MAHRVILTAFSRVFNDVINEKSVQILDIKIQGMNHDDIKTIVQFMYLGEVSVAHAGVDKFLRVAKFLERNEETIVEEAPKCQEKSGEYDDTAETIDYEESNAET